MDTNKRNGLVPIIAQAIEEMEVETGFSIPLENINLAELERRTGLSRSKLRTLQAKGFKEQPHGLKGKPKGGILKGYTGILDSLLSQGITNSVVCLERLRQEGFTGGRTTVKDYIAAHKYLVPVRRTQTAPQGNRGRRYMTGPGEAFQMDWGFTKVLNPNGAEYQVACFAMICHHCGQRYVEFFPNAKQENLFIGMIHACVQNAGCLSMDLSAMREFALVFRPIIFCRQSESLETRIRSESFPTIFHGSWFHIPSRGVDRTKSVQGSLRKYLSQKSFRQLG